MEDFFDILIVGAGPSGMFSAYKLLRNSPRLKVGIIDKGNDIIQRINSKEVGENIVSGAGGAGLFSDGKLTLTLNAGGNLDISDTYATKYINFIKNTLIGLDGSSVLKNPCFYENFIDYDLNYKPLPIRHFGTYNLKKVLIKFWEELSELGVNSYFNNKVIDFHKEKESFKVITQTNRKHKKILRTKRLIFAVGKEGSLWLGNILDKKFDIKSKKNRIYLGVRLETPFAEKLSKISFDPKFYMYFSDNSKIKIHCFNRRGKVLSLKYFGLPLAGGHSPFTEKNSCNYLNLNTSFAVLLSDTNGKKFDLEIVLKYMSNINKLTNGNLLVQRLEDFINNEPTTYKKLERNSIQPSQKDAIPGNIASLNLQYNFNDKFIDFIIKLSKVDPSFYTGDILIYAPVVEWWMPKIETAKNLETSVKDLYVIGDGAGVSQGISYAGTTGLIAAESILDNLD